MGSRQKAVGALPSPSLVEEGQEFPLFNGFFQKVRSRNILSYTPTIKVLQHCLNLAKAILQCLFDFKCFKFQHCLRDFI